MQVSNFVVQSEPTFEDGAYKAKIKLVQLPFYSTASVHWLFLDGKYKDMKLVEYHYLYHRDNFTRELATKNFNRFCRDIGGLNDGDTPRASDFIDKIAWITIKNKKTRYHEFFPNIVKRVPICGELPQGTVISNTNNM